jgi:hypothetical protein
MPAHSPVVASSRAELRSAQHISHNLAIAIPMETGIAAFQDVDQIYRPSVS